ncbi:MAG: hypothetical protein N2V78_10285 [Methanophagales archaeon]|nr:hypothetical protein [Methanophagales archaeon]
MRYELYETENAEKNRKELGKKDTRIKDNIKKAYERLSQEKEFLGLEYLR